MTMLDKLIPISLRVDYGPSHDTGGHPFFWHCNPCRGEIGGYEDTLAEAKRKADEEAGTHRGARAVHCEG
jgi:hypothetical protein